MTTNTQHKTLSFLQNTFQQYYQNHSPLLPDRFARREYAFVFYGGKGMMRHLSFTKSKKLTQFLAEKAPAHSYYSSAYYQTPDASTMDEKKWMGAELIFDLDSDHLPNADTMTYEQSLDKVKIEFIKLVHEFLLDDFGFNKKYVELYFSGGRGYHCHIKDPKIFDLDSSERREIVDYITGRDLRDTIVFREKATNRKHYGPRTYASGKQLKMPKPEEPGWKGRISRGIISLVTDIMESPDPINRLKEIGVKQADAEKLLRDLSEERIQRIKNGYLDQSRTIKRFFLNKAIRKTAVQLTAGETDEPVTCDIKRLIRLPGSLHGKTGFVVSQIDIDKLLEFDPLTECVIINDDNIDISLSQPYTSTIKNQKFKLSKGNQTVPRYLAVFLLGRRIARVT